MSTNGTHRSHAKRHSYPIPQPVKVGHTTAHHRGPQALLFLKSDVGSFTSHKNKSVKVLWDGTYGFSSLSEKTRKSNHLQMTLQKQHFLLSYLKTLSVGPAEVWTRGPDRLSPNWANQAAFFICIEDLIILLTFPFSRFSLGHYHLWSWKDQ